jgi:hypothetical protein
MIKIYHPTMKVFTGPQWLFDAFNGYTNAKNTAMILPIIDPDGKPIISKNIITDSTWNLQDEINGKPIIDWLVEIPYCYYEGEI